MSAYLFVHFKEKRTPDGEQVYFALSRDGFHWETVNDGNPVLWSYQGDKGVRDFTITNVSKVRLNVFDVNERARRCYEKASFSVESFTPDALTFKGESWGRYLMVASAFLES